MVIKDTGDIVQVNKKREVSSKDKSNVTQGELDLVDQLIRMGEQAFCSDEATTLTLDNNAEKETSLDFNPSISSTEATRHKLPDLDFHFDGAQEKDFSSLDDIFT